MLKVKLSLTRIFFPFRLYVNFVCPIYRCILLVFCFTLRLMILFYLSDDDHAKRNAETHEFSGFCPS